MRKYLHEYHKLRRKMAHGCSEADRRRLDAMHGKVVEFINGIDDKFIQRIFVMRYLFDRSWQDIASEIGGGNTEDSVRMMHIRYLERL